MFNPIFNYRDGEITNLKGDVSRLFRVKGDDIYQYKKDKKLAVFDDLLVKIAFENNGPFKIYHFDNIFYLNAKTSPFKDSELVKNLDIKIFQKINFYEDYFSYDFKFFRVLRVKEFPPDLRFGEYQNYGDYIGIFRPLFKVEPLKKLEIIKRKLISLSFSKFKETQINKALIETDELISNTLDKQDGLVGISIFHILKSDTKLGLDTLTREYIKKYEFLGGRLFVESYSLKYLIYFLFPGVRAKNLWETQLNARFATSLIPIFCDYIHDKGINLKSVNGSTVQFNLFDNHGMNKNMIISGSSGQGKSMLACKLLHFEIGKKTNMIIIDLGGSYKKLINQIKGVNLSNHLYFDNSLSSSFYLEFFLSLLNFKIDPINEARAIDLIKKYLDSKEFKLLDLSNLVKDYLPGIDHQILRYSEYLLSEPLKKNEGVFYIDLKDYPEKLRSGALIYLIERFKALKSPKVLCFDECWNLLNDNSDFVSNAFRTLRKSNASAIGISQNIEDFIKTDLGRVIYNNSYYKIYFRQDLKKDSLLESEDQKKVLKLKSIKDKYSEFFLITEKNRKKLRYYATSEEWDLFNTENNDSGIGGRLPAARTRFS